MYKIYASDSFVSLVLIVELHASRVCIGIFKRPSPFGQVWAPYYFLPMGKSRVLRFTTLTAWYGVSDMKTNRDNNPKSGIVTKTSNAKTVELNMVTLLLNFANKLAAVLRSEFSLLYNPMYTHTSQLIQ